MTLSKPRRCAWRPKAGARRPRRSNEASPKLLYRWQQAQLVAEVGSVEVARDPEVRSLRARLKRAEQELDVLKKALVIFGQPTR